jgi:MFS family permease
VAAAVQHGVLAGLRFLLRDKLLAPMAATVVVFGFLSAGMSAGLPVYAYDEFDGHAWIAGLFYGALGAGALVGSLVAVFAVRRVAPLRLAALGILAFSVPLWVLPFLPPWPVVIVALFTATFFTPLVNGPTVAVLTARTPENLRAKVMTAVISVNTLAAPLGFLVAGQVLENWGVVPLFTAVVLGITWTAIVFASITWRHSDAEPTPELAAT